MNTQLADIGIGTRDVGDFLSSVLKNSSKPLTRVLEHLSGVPLAIKVLADGKRPLTEAEAYRLRAAGVTGCRWRTGLLLAPDGTVAASTALTWIPARLPFDACRDLDAGAQPAGIILGRLGMYRTDRRAMATRMMEEVTGQDAAVIASAVLEVDGQAVGIAGETITRAFAEALAGQSVTTTQGNVTIGT